MDVLVLDAPMKFIHGKMVEQGADEWSRYLMSQFNPIGRGTLYKEHFDKEKGLRVYLYSAAITLECVGENKGYLKVVKAEDTDVLTYHKAIEEGKLLEEKITFVPVYKFQYINGKEHHDVERFMQDEKEKRDFENYVRLWESFVTDDHKEVVQEDLILRNEVMKALKCLYDGKAANPNMSEIMPTVEKLKPFELKEWDSTHFTAQYDMFSEEQKYATEQMLSTEDLYFVDTQGNRDAVPFIREMATQVSANGKKVLVMAPHSKQVEALLQEIEEHCTAEVAQLQDVEESKYTLEYKVKHLRDSVLHKLTEEVSNHNRHKEELDQMRAECDVYQYAEKTIKLGFNILETLEKVKQDKVILQEESKALGEQGQAYVEALEKYAEISNEEHETYGKLKEKLRKSDDLYDEILWMKTYRASVGYQEYKSLVFEYSKEVRVFEEKLSSYKAQIKQRNDYETQSKELEAKLLEARRQYLKVEALKQIDPTGSIVEDTKVQETIEVLEQELIALRQSKDEIATGIMNTRYLDELKASVYKLKEEVEVYMNAYNMALQAACYKEEITKADVIDIFKRMHRVEELFEDESTYTAYLEGVEAYLELEVVVEQNNQLLKLQETNQEEMGKLLKKQEELISLLETKLEEKFFKDFLELIGEGDEWVQHILQEPFSKESVESLEKLEAAVRQRAFKLEIYKDKVAFYDALAKLKSDWQLSLEENQELLIDYLVSKLKVIGATHYALTKQENSILLKDNFDYIIINEAQDMPYLELLISLVKGKKAILIGDSTKNQSSLFTKLYMRCQRTHKKALIEVK